jgi:dihydroorotase
LIVKEPILRSVVIFLGLTFSLAAQTHFDLLLKGGHVIDPKNAIDRVTDVAIASGRIARIAENIPESEARKVVDVKGLYVTPGLIDIHVHLYARCPLPPGAHDEAVDPDAFSFRSGITTMVDAGSSGCREFPDFRDRIINKAHTRVLAFLNIVSSGMGTGKEDEPSEMDAEAAARMAQANPSTIVGFKSAHYAGPGWSSVEGAVRAGELTHLPVMVDFGLITRERNINTLFMDKLRPGDIYTHCFSGHREELLESGKLNPVMAAGRKRGIFFDVGFGSASFYWYVAAPAYQAGFHPDSVSTDLHKFDFNEGMKDIDNVMSELMSLGSSFTGVIRMATWAPAQEIKRPELGNLDINSEADLAIFRLEQGHFGFLDSAGARNFGKQRIICELTVQKGQVVWDLNGLASENWKDFKYRKGPFPQRGLPAATTRP